MPPKAKARKKAEDPAPATRPRRTKTFRKLALAAATLASMAALFQRSRGATKFQSLGAARLKQWSSSNMYPRTAKDAEIASQSVHNQAPWKRGDDLGLTGKKAGTSHTQALYGDLVATKAFQDAVEGLASDISTSRSLKPSEKLDAVTVGGSFLRHVNPRRMKFTRPMKLLGAAAAILLALSGKSRLEGVVSRGLKTNKPFSQEWHIVNAADAERAPTEALGKVSSKKARPKTLDDMTMAEKNKLGYASSHGAGLPKKKLKGACHGGPCEDEKYSDVLE